MSWSRTYASRGDFYNDAPEQPADGSKLPELDATESLQLESARRAARSIVESGAIAQAAEITIALEGHADPKPTPSGERTGESVSVTITQTD
jgi:hypothetical protein